VDQEFRKNIQIDRRHEAIKIFLAGKSLLAFKDIQKAPYYEAKKEARKRNWVSLLAAPMIAQNRVTGIIDAYTYTERKFAPLEKQLQATFAA